MSATPRRPRSPSRTRPRRSPPRCRPGRNGLGKSDAAPVANGRGSPRQAAETSATSAAETLKPLATDAAPNASRRSCAILSPETVQRCFTGARNRCEQAREGHRRRRQPGDRRPPAAPSICLLRSPAEKASAGGETQNESAASASPSGCPQRRRDVASPAGETAEKIAALEQPAGIDRFRRRPLRRISAAAAAVATARGECADEALSPFRRAESSGQPADSFEPERVQPATSPSDAPTEPWLSLSVNRRRRARPHRRTLLRRPKSLQPIARPQGAAPKRPRRSPLEPQSATAVAPSAETVTGLEPEVVPPAVQPLESDAAPAAVFPASRKPPSRSSSRSRRHCWFRPGRAPASARRSTSRPTATAASSISSGNMPAATASSHCRR